MQIALVEPYCTGSHAAWATEYAAHSRHQVELFTLAGRNWKWRMHGGAVTLATRFLAAGKSPDLILATDMLDLTTFLALTRPLSDRCRSAIYFHENQLTYPWSPGDPDPGEQRDLHYAFINYVSALAADAVLFNSRYHMDSFLGELPAFLKRFPDAVDVSTVELIAAKSRVLPLGLDLRKLEPARPAEPAGNDVPLLLWNHRWEYDKAPDAFFEALYRLADEGVEFRVAVLGESFGRVPPVFKQARERLGARVVEWGYQKSFAEYAKWLWRADILPVTSRQEFFGASVVQALYCGCQALLPDRLAYPEHVPQGASEAVLYRDDESLVDRLRNLLLGNGQGRGVLDGHVARYDWERLAPVYDDFFSGLVGSGEGCVPEVSFG
ncbi:tRNA-queuosine alpha-mannosyltransferase domain-containing protein [Geomonas subterranea]|uniref:tRNA-queuosine alpha-mannosyltransferase n=1 Tax=Geomonas subterranea TaxID=2847989 RepID=A0ABX8LKI2_9BACT|nr:MULTISPECIES: DUF3524 domain-containing protein [Geomonas]QXE92207.1 DUF3524 domain-containing protein [Geomonas subterranea]QXM09694.1 DUF3524 domain-containing protein [Geomonas subterranea]